MNHSAFMHRAIQLAARGRHAVNPNPMVGAVIVKDGTVVGEGYHERFGKAHAEVNAIKAAGEDACGATLYVNLEPCCHQGKTPPCTQAIIDAKIARVVVGMLDPNPLVRGNGIKILQEHRIDVITDVEVETARDLNKVFFKYMTSGLPFVTMKIAQTLDGRIATRSGHSRWITGPAARAEVHQIRCDNDAILVGIGTVLADNPQLTIRHVDGNQPKRIVLDSQLRIPLDAHLLTDQYAAQTIIATTRPESKAYKLIQKNGALIWQTEADEFGGIALKPLLTKLANHNISALMVEGGAHVFTSFLQKKCVDRLIIMMAPKLIGKGTDAIGMLNIDRIDESYQLRDVSVRQLGDDIIIDGEVNYS